MMATMVTVLAGASVDTGRPSGGRVHGAMLPTPALH